jgi:exodeoxyribonuclease V alpha subunit
MNGDIGVTLRLPDDRHPPQAEDRRFCSSVFLQPDGSLKFVLPSRLTDIETVYAMTVHKSQGSEFTHVALVLPDTLSQVLTRELIYTGITRAKQWCSLVLSDAAVLAQALTRKVRRSGRLGELLAL